MKRTVATGVLDIHISTIEKKMLQVLDPAKSTGLQKIKYTILSNNARI